MLKTDTHTYILAHAQACTCIHQNNDICTQHRGCLKDQICVLQEPYSWGNSKPNWTKTNFWGFLQLPLLSGFLYSEGHQCGKWNSLCHPSSYYMAKTLLSQMLVVGTRALTKFWLQWENWSSSGCGICNRCQYCVEYLLQLNPSITIHLQIYTRD